MFLVNAQDIVVASFAGSIKPLGKFDSSTHNAMWTMLPETPRRSDGIHNDFSSLTNKILGIFQFAAAAGIFHVKPSFAVSDLLQGVACSKQLITNKLATTLIST